MRPVKRENTPVLPWVATESLPWGSTKDPVKRMNQAFASIFCPVTPAEREFKSRAEEAIKSLGPVPWTDL